MYACIIWYMYYFVMFGFSKLVDRVVEWMKPDISTESIVDWVKNTWTNLLNWDTLNNLKQKYLDSKKNTDWISDDELLKGNNNY